MMSTNFSLVAPRVLLLEENRLFRIMIQAMLEIIGVTCCTPQHPEEALEIFQKGCDLVLIDLDLENPENFELVKKMRVIEAANHKYTPIIGHTLEIDLAQIETLSLDAKLDCAYPKINNLQELHLILSEWLAHPYEAPPSVIAA